jgi:hypothetical protein
MSPKSALARAIANLTEEQAMQAYNALAQWADNERIGLEETYDAPTAEKLAQVETVEGLVEAYETELVQLAAAPRRQDLHS